MLGFEPEFLSDIVKNSNAPMVLNTIGWFRDIQPWWHVKGESAEKHWERLAGFGIKPFFGEELNLEGVSKEDTGASHVQGEEESEHVDKLEGTREESGALSTAFEETSDSYQLSPRAEQTIGLMRQYNSLLEDAKLVYTLAQEEEATEDERVELLFHYNDIIEKGKKILDRIEEFGYFYKQEQMDNGFVIDKTAEQIKDWRD